MEREVEQLKRLIHRDVVLDATEKEAMRDKLVSFMMQNPVPLSTPVSKSIISPFATIGLMMRFALALLVIVSAGGGVSALAEGSLPGDILYPVKVGINEPIISVIHGKSDDYNSGQYAIAITERRLEEVEQLANKNRLTLELKNQVEDEVLKNISNADQIIKKLESSGKEDESRRLSMELESSLEVHQDILVGLDANKNETERYATDLARTIDVEGASLAASRTSSQTLSTMTTTLGNAVTSNVEGQQKELAELRLAIREMQAKVGSDFYSSGEIKSLVESVGNLVAQAGDDIGRGDGAGASLKIEQARAILKKVSVIASSKVVVPTAVITQIVEERKEADAVMMSASPAGSPSSSATGEGAVDEKIINGIK